jgi:uncharacterized cupredoxin-like copper-binding protein
MIKEVQLMKRLILAATVTLSLTCGLLSLPLATSTHASTMTRIGVGAYDDRFTLSRRSVRAGTTVIFAVTNKGEAMHDFAIANKVTPSLSPGETARLRMTFAKPGRYYYECTLFGHAEMGMRGMFRVLP